jgi:putative SOS response-associated peptidase YedK
MCGRFTLKAKPEQIAAAFGLPSVSLLEPRYNVAPTQAVAAVRLDGDTGTRRLDLLRWGLVPSWADDPSIGNRMINARAETVAEKPAFRSAFKKRRCLIVADGFYEFIWTNPIPLPLRRGSGRSHRAQLRHDTRPVWQRSRMRRCRRTEAG